MYTKPVADGSSHYKTLQDNRMEENKYVEKDGCGYDDGADGLPVDSLQSVIN